MISIQDLYKNSLEQEKKLLDKCKTLDSVKDIAGFAPSLSSKNLFKFLYFFFKESNIEKSKQTLYLSAKCYEFSYKYYKKSNPIIQRAFYLLLSDSDELIDSFKNWEFNNHEYWLKRGSLVLVIQEILKNNQEQALQLLKVFEDKHKKYPLKEQDSAILKAIIKKNIKEVEELLEFFLLPKNHKKINDPLMLSTELFSLHATGFAKLAWLKGIEVNVDHPLLPMELLPTRPNKEYKIEYDFLKEEYKPVINTKKEVPKPNPKYRKDKPKNKIGITQNLIKKLIVQNWEASYTDRELQKYVEIIYNAFINPQKADSKYYDFAKLGNLHISHSNKQFIFIEKKPFTNMWTVLKNEIDYFFDLVNSSFDIIGANLINDEQYNHLKSTFEENAKKNKGFLGKWLN